MGWGGGAGFAEGDGGGLASTTQGGIDAPVLNLRLDHYLMITLPDYITRFVG